MSEEQNKNKADVQSEDEQKTKVESESSAERTETDKKTVEKDKPSADKKALSSDKEKPAAAKVERAKAAAAKKKKTEEDDEPKPPSPNQPTLDRIAAIIRQEVSEDAVVETFINELDHDLPCIVIDSRRWVETSKLLKEHEDLTMIYLRNVSGVDYETHLEVVYHLLSLERVEDVCIKIRTDRDNPSIPSATPVWRTANWHEREIFDLLGIDFPGHPDLTRIMMPDDWIGHPLRKDYEPFDPEV